MKQLIPWTLLCLPACTLFGGLTDEQQLQLNEHRLRSQQYFNARHYEKSIDQAERGLTIDRYDYGLRSSMGWSYLELASQHRLNNVENLRRARLVFEEIIEWRDIEDHDQKTIFGFAKALYNQARLDQLEANLLRVESKKPEHDQATAAEFISKATEFEKLAAARDQQSEHYFLALANGDVAGRVNKKEAYEYLMVLRYRAKDFDQAIAYGKKTLEINDEQTKFFDTEYKATRFPQREVVIREELKRLHQSETAIRSTLAKYHREKGGEAENKIAIRHLDEVIKARPNSFEEYYRRGTCHRNVKDHAKAREDFKTFLRFASLPAGNQQIRDANEYLYGKGK